MTILVAAFALLALTIAGVGIYGVVSYTASLRTLEFGVRLSVGATPLDIAGLVLHEAGTILAGGIVFGVPLTCMGLLAVRHQLEPMSLRQPRIYLGALVLLAACTLIAAWVPAERTKRMNVHDALKHQ